MVFFIVITLFIISLFLLYKAYNIKINKDEQLNKIRNQIKELLSTQEALLKTKTETLEQIKNTKQQLISLYQKKDDVKKEIDEEIQDKRNNINKLYNDLKQKSSEAFALYENQLDKAYDKKEQEIKSQINQIQKQKQKYQSERDSLNDEIAQLKSIYQAATAAKLREQEEQEKWSFYRIRISDQQVTDISRLQQFKKSLYDPSIASKVIWSSYIMKPTSDMCNRVLGKSTVCGIYKITNKATGEVYIGQSVDIATRWKNHIKCGLGIDASATNTLYNNMQSTGVWNFTFELLQKCERSKLNEKERFWIDMYSSNKVGLNTRGGVK